METQTIVSTEIKNKPGKLAAVARCLANGNVNIEGFEVEGGVAHFLTSDAALAASCLKDGGFAPKTQAVFAVTLSNQPGQLANLAEALGNASVNIDATFGVASGDSGRIYVSVDNEDAAAPIIEQVAAGGSRAATPGQN